MSVLSLLPLDAGEHFAVFSLENAEVAGHCLLLLLGAWNAIRSVLHLILHDKTKKQRQN